MLLKTYLEDTLAFGFVFFGSTSLTIEGNEVLLVRPFKKSNILSFRRQFDAIDQRQFINGC